MMAMISTPALGGLVKQFFVPDSASKQRCDLSRNNGVADTFSGVDTVGGNVGIYTAMVQSVEGFGLDAPQGRRWRVTLRPAP
jgi:hypothetical protein